MRMKKMVTALAALALTFGVCASGASAELKEFSGAPHFLPAPVIVVGTYTPAGNSNFATFHRGGVLATGDATYLGFGVEPRRKDIVSFTYDCVTKQKYCSINIPARKNLEGADLVGAFSGQPVGSPPRGPVSANPDGTYTHKITGNDEGFQDKAKAAGLTVDASDARAPTLEDFPISLICEYVGDMTANASGVNNKFVIVKVLKVLVDERYLESDGRVNPVVPDDTASALYYFAHGGNGGYYALGDFLGKSGEVSAKYR